MNTNKKSSERLDVGCVVTMQYVSPGPFKTSGIYSKNSRDDNSDSGFSEIKDKRKTKMNTTYIPPSNYTSPTAIASNSSTTQANDNSPKKVPLAPSLQNNTSSSSSDTKTSPFPNDTKTSQFSNDTKTSSFPKTETSFPLRNVKNSSHSSDSLGAFFPSSTSKRSFPEASKNNAPLLPTCSKRSKESACQAAARILQLNEVSGIKTGNGSSDKPKNDGKRRLHTSETSPLHKQASDPHSSRNLLQVAPDAELSSLLKELEDEWEKVGPGAQAKQTRFMRSQQDLREKMEAKAAVAEHSEGGDVGVEEAEVVDPYDFLEPVEILSKLPKNFYTQIEEKKWQERKLALEACEKLVTENRRLAPDDYGDFVKALKKVLSKDTNILLVVVAIKCLGALASGLRKKFHQYALVCLDGMFERFKEKKVNVIAALQEAVDAIYLTTSIQAVSETVIEALGHKNPSIRCQVGLFLSRSLTKTKAAAVNKALMKLFLQPLFKNIDHSSPEVREAAFQSIGAMLKLVGEAKLNPFIADLDKLKLDKINDCAGKTEASGSKSRSTSAPTAQAPSKTSNKAASTSGKDARPKSSSGKTAEKKETKTSTSKAGGAPKKSKAAPKQVAATQVEAELTEEAVDDLVLKVISEEERKQILNPNWKERLAGLQATFQKLRVLEKNEIPCQAFVKLFTMKPGWKDNNFNCMIEKFKILAFLAENSTFSRTSAGCCLLPTVDKIGDVKAGASAKAALTAMSESCTMPWVAEQVLDHAMSQKNPKIQSESISWFSQAMRDFGIAGLNVKLVIDKIKIALAATNPAVRTSTFALIGSLTLFMGEKTRMLFESEKPAILQQIDSEMEKVKGQTPPAPCRGVKKQKSRATEEMEEEDEEEGQDVGVNFDDMVTRIDVGDKITDGLIAKLNDKNWKVRKEGLDAVTEILNEAKFIEANLGDLPPALKARLSDSNKILITTTLNILTQLSTSLGPQSTKYVSVLSASIINALADSKPQVRQAALKCMDTWLENSKLSQWIEGDTISSALSNPRHTNLRIELFNWLSEKLIAAKKLPSNAKEGLELCIPVVFVSCEDRNAEIRAKAQAFLPALLRHLPYEKLVRATGKLSATSKTVVMPLLEKAREQVPAPSAPSKPSAKPSSAATRPPPAEAVEEQPTKQGANSAKEKRPSVKKEDSKKRAPSAQRKQKQSEEDTSPMFIQLPNGKEQRMKDEVKLKTIKWHFNVPRGEVITQLQQQLATCVGPALMGELFHADFQHHLKAVSMLLQALNTDWQSTVNCLDILLRWFTLRFYDKNTTVHIKSLDYLKALFDKLIENEYRMSEYEASAFLPHLITKIGESKDNIRKAVQGIIKQVSLVYSASKLFTYIMDGIKSKNSRQRSECLDQIGLLIETYGVNVCQPTPSKALKEIAANISDRDKSVRSSALNAIVAAYNVSGEIVYKQVGRLNEKDMSMLEERIKRSGKFQEGGAAPPATRQERVASAPASTSKTMKETKSMPTNLAKESAAIEKSRSAPRVQELHSASPPKQQQLLSEHIKQGISQLKEINIDHLLEPLPMPTFLKEQEERKVPHSAGAALDVSISQIASTCLDTAILAIHELYEVLRHPENIPLLEERMEQMLTSSTTQLRMTTDRYLPLIVTSDKATENIVDTNSFKSLCKSHFAFLLEVFGSHVLCARLSFYSIYDFLRTLLPLMVNDQFVLLPYSSRLIQIMNMLILRIMDHADPTAITCSCFRVLYDSMESGSTSYYEVAMKCIWKLARMIPQFFSPELEEGFRHEVLKIAPVLAEMDRFLTAYPRNHDIYVKLKTDMPLRSVKTVVLTICKQPGVEMLEELHMILHPERSEVIALIEKAVGRSRGSRPHRSSHKKENMGSGPAMSLDIKLSGIFKKIGDRQLTKQGLLELYEFRMEHPHYDVDSRIDALEVEFFRDYVKRGLKKIDDEKSSKGQATNPQRINVKDRKKNTEEFFSRLNRLRETCGLEPLNKEEMKKRSISSDSTQPLSSKVLVPNTSSLNHSEPLVNKAKSASSLTRATTAPNPSSGPSAAAGASSSLLDIKRRLEQIKQSRH